MINHHRPLTLSIVHPVDTPDTITVSLSPQEFTDIIEALSIGAMAVLSERNRAREDAEQFSKHAGDIWDNWRQEAEDKDAFFDTTRMALDVKLWDAAVHAGYYVYSAHIEQ